MRVVKFQTGLDSSSVFVNSASDVCVNVDLSIPTPGRLQ